MQFTEIVTNFFHIKIIFYFSLHILFFGWKVINAAHTQVGRREETSPPGVGRVYVYSSEFFYEEDLSLLFHLFNYFFISIWIHVSFILWVIIQYYLFSCPHFPALAIEISFRHVLLPFDMPPLILTHAADPAVIYLIHSSLFLKLQGQKSVQFKNFPPQTFFKLGSPSCNLVYHMHKEACWVQLMQRLFFSQ